MRLKRLLAGGREVAHLEQVADVLHAVDAARDALGLGALVGGVHATGEGHDAFVGGDVDVAGLDVVVLDEVSLDGGGDLAVVDLRLRRLGAAASGQGERAADADRHQGCDEQCWNLLHDVLLVFAPCRHDADLTYRESTSRAMLASESSQRFSRRSYGVCVSATSARKKLHAERNPRRASP